MVMLSEETKYLIDYWLRGAVKGYSVRLDEAMDSFEYTKEEQRTVFKELCEISDSDRYEMILLWNGLEETDEL
jgi:hypothetical protein